MTALACEFSWSEEFILLWLPRARGEQYYHALLRRAGWRTFAPAASAEDQLAAYEADEEAPAEDAPVFEPLSDEILKRWGV